MLSAAREQAVADLLDYFRLKALSLLVENRHLLEDVADLLYRRAYLLPSDLAAMPSPMLPHTVW